MTISNALHTGLRFPTDTPVSVLFERGVKPNFNAAALESDDDRVDLLGHSIYPIFAFAEPRDDNSCELSFRDLPAISDALQRMFPDVAIATLEELSRPIEKADLEKLDCAEIEQVKYGKPTTIDEPAFTWWD